MDRELHCPHLHIGERALPAFRTCGVVGFVVGTALGSGLAALTGRSPVTVLAMAGAAAVAFFALAMATKVVTGEESLSFYHHAALALAVCVVVAAARGGPVAPYLDLAAGGLAAFLACGRVGCLLVGCCHGRPSGRGVRYGPEHAAEGFPAYLVGVRLFPIQAVESIGVTVIVVLACATLLADPGPGSVAAAVVVAYALLRFLVEFARGDADRRELAGFSEAQWTSLAACVAVAVVSTSGWPLVAGAAIAATMAMVARSRRRRPHRLDQIDHPRHVRELAVAAERSLRLGQTGGRPPSAGDPPVNLVPIGGTSLGVLVSAGIVDSEHGPAVHYAFSHCTGVLADPVVDRVAHLLLRLRHDDDRAACRLVVGDHGVTHLFVAPDALRPADAEAL